MLRNPNVHETRELAASSFGEDVFTHQGRTELKPRIVRKKSALTAPSVVRFYVITTSLLGWMSTTLKLLFTSFDYLLLTSLCAHISVLSIDIFGYCFFVPDVNVRARSSQP